MSAERWHGTGGGYSNHKCRCADCRAAHAAVMRERRARLYSGPCPMPGCHRSVSKKAGTGFCDPCSDEHRKAIATMERNLPPTLDEQYGRIERIRQRVADTALTHPSDCGCLVCHAAEGDEGAFVELLDGQGDDDLVAAFQYGESS